MKPAYFPLVLIMLLTSCHNSQKATGLDHYLSGGRWIDLTYPFSAETIYWPNNPTGFKLDTQTAGMTSKGYYYSSNAFAAPEHGGTHLDAPIHFAEGKLTVDQVPLQQLQGAAVVVDVSQKALQNRDYLVTVADIEAWEKGHGTIPDSAIVLIRTGYGRYYPDKRTTLGTDRKGDAAIPLLHFPGLDPAAAEWLATRRRVRAVGLDTPSIDYGQSTLFEAHRALLGRNIPIFENVAHLDQLPVVGSYIIALPMNIKNGTGAPLRMVAWVKRSQ